MSPLDCLSQPWLRDMFTRAPEYRRKMPTLIRRVRPEEVGMSLVTWVRDTGHENASGLREESTRRLTSDMLVLRNPEAAGKDADGREVFNEWAADTDSVRRSYGDAAVDEASDHFQEHRKLAKVRALQLSDGFLHRLGVRGTAGLTLRQASSGLTMVAHRGDFLTEDGYSIGKAEMGQTYVLADDDGTPEKSAGAIHGQHGDDRHL